MSDLNDKMGKFADEEDEKMVFEASVKVYTNEVLKSSL